MSVGGRSGGGAHNRHRVTARQSHERCLCGGRGDARFLSFAPDARLRGRPAPSRARGGQSGWPVPRRARSSPRHAGSLRRALSLHRLHGLEVPPEKREKNEFASGCRLRCVACSGRVGWPAGALETVTVWAVCSSTETLGGRKRTPPECRFLTVSVPSHALGFKAEKCRRSTPTFQRGDIGPTRTGAGRRPARASRQMEEIERPSREATTLTSTWALSGRASKSARAAGTGFDAMR